MSTLSHRVMPMIEPICTPIPSSLWSKSLTSPGFVEFGQCELSLFVGICTNSSEICLRLVCAGSDGFGFQPAKFKTDGLSPHLHWGRHFSCRGDAEVFTVLALRELDGRDRPFSVVADDGDSQAMKFVKPDVLNCSGLTVHEDHGLADKLGLRLFERAEDR
jgi:hypothetical protein